MPTMIAGPRSSQYQYHVGGTVPADASSYVEREANIQLYNTLKALKFCYIFNSRQNGKSSIEGWARKRLEKDGFACAYLDFSQVGTQSVKEEQWYVSVLQRLAKELGLEIRVSEWWKQQGNLTPSACLSHFFEEVLLARIQSKIVITIDEIDSVFGLNFSTDDFFAFIRSCYNQRSNKSAYERLTFLLIGVATPSDLMENKQRTPFNLGHAINLTGFNPSETQPLARGLEGVVANPAIVLEEILAWTNGQPFLTQKICNLIYENEIIIQSGDEKKHVGDIIKQTVIVNWEEQDNPEHLRTIEQRILHGSGNDTEKAHRLLALYQTIFDEKRVKIDNTPEQSELMLSGLVVKEAGFIRIANRIYQTIFNPRWITKSLASLKPYSEAMRAWQTSEYKDNSRLLHGKALQDALVWIQDKTLAPLDKKFIQESKKYSQRLFLEEAQNIATENRLECDRILRVNIKHLTQIAEDPKKLIEEISQWIGTTPSLLAMLITLIAQRHRSISVGEETSKVKEVIETYIIRGWEDQVGLSSPLIKLRNDLFKQARKNEILKLYRTILSEKTVIIDDRPDLKALLRLGLVTISISKEKKVKVVNRIYELCFNHDWIENELTKIESGFVISNRYEVTRKLSQKDLITTYLVKDKYDPNPETREYLAKQFIPNQYIEGREHLMDEIRTLFSSMLQILGEVSKVDQIPEFHAMFEENKAFYLIQEYIKGKTLESDIPAGKALPQKRVTNLLIEVLEVLDSAHKAGLKHLDLHPGNLMRRYSDHQLVLIDFAIFQSIAAQIIQTSPSGNPIRIGTPGYEPLEQLEGKSDFISDIYAVGMIGVQALTGVNPTKLPDDKQTGAKIWRYDAPGKDKSDVDERLVKIIGNMIHPDLDSRCPTASDALNQLIQLRRAWEKEVEKQQKEKQQEDEAKKAQERETKIKAKRRRIWRRVQWIISPLAIGGLGVGAFFSFNAYKIAENAKQRQICDTPLVSSEGNLTNAELIGNALAVEENCTASLSMLDTVTGVDKPSALVRLGQSRLVLWHHAIKLENDTSAQTKLHNAVLNFQEAANRNNGAASFYEGLTKAIQISEVLDENSYHQVIAGHYNQAVNDYLVLPDTLEGDSDEVPILVRLAFSRINQNNLEQENLRQANQLFEKILGRPIDDVVGQQNLPIKDLELIYNQAVINARAIASSDAIALFEKIIETLTSEQDTQQGSESGQQQTEPTPEEPSLLDKAYQSLGFTYFFLGFQDPENFNKAQNNFNQMQVKSTIVESVLPTLNRCLSPPSPGSSNTATNTNTNEAEAEANEANASTATSNQANESDCLTLLQETQETLKADPNVIFPIAPVYECTENPALAIAEQALIDRGLEPESTKLCR